MCDGYKMRVRPIISVFHCAIPVNIVKQQILLNQLICLISSIHRQKLVILRFSFSFSFFLLRLLFFNCVCFIFLYFDLYIWQRATTPSSTRYISSLILVTCAHHVLKQTVVMLQPYITFFLSHRSYVAFRSNEFGDIQTSFLL